MKVIIDNQEIEFDDTYIPEEIEFDISTPIDIRLDDLTLMANEELLKPESGENHG